jgi:hypothetical protein
MKMYLTTGIGLFEMMTSFLWAFAAKKSVETPPLSGFALMGTQNRAWTQHYVFVDDDNIRPHKNADSP